MERDLCSKEFYSDDERYADLINGIVCGGEQVVKKEDLQPLDTQSGFYKIRGFQRGWPGKGRQFKARDLIRRTAFGMNFAVIGIENQEELDYALPLRAMSYDVREYEAQAAKIRKEVRKSGKELTPGEYLYGFARCSRLHPVVTIVLYYGEEEWDASRELHGMIDFSEIPEAFRKLVQNYQVHVVEVRKLKDTEVFRTDIRLVFDYIRYAGQPEKLKELTESNPAYKQMEEDAFDMAVTYAKVRDWIQRKEPHKEKRTVDANEHLNKMIQYGMGKGIKQGREEGREEGIEQGIEQGIKALIETCQDLGVTKDATAERIVEKFSMSALCADKYMKKYWRNH